MLFPPDQQQKNEKVISVAIPTSSNASTSPGPHAQISPQSLAEKPHSSSPPQPKSPMPPTASLTAASTDLLDLESSKLTSIKGQDGSATAAGSSSGPSSRELSSAAANQPHTSSAPAIPIPSPPAEVEATLSKLTSHANVIGVLVLSRPEALVIRSGGAYFEPSGPGARERAMRLKSSVEMIRNVVTGLERDIPKSEVDDELAFLRIRTKKYEMMISPSEKYLLVVLQVSNSSMITRERESQHAHEKARPYALLRPRLFESVGPYHVTLEPLSSSFCPCRACL